MRYMPYAHVREVSYPVTAAAALVLLRVRTPPSCTRPRPLPRRSADEAVSAAMEADSAMEAAGIVLI